MTAWLVAGIIFLLFLLLTTVVNVVFGPRLNRAPGTSARPSVSVLVPARNEAGRIEKCLDSLLKQSYPLREIIVLDDESSDETHAIVREMSRNVSNLKIIRGKPLPEGWTGKNWACFQLQEQAVSDILIFTDADTWHGKDAVQHTVGWMNHFQLGFLSAFPRQITGGFAEKLLMPLLNILIYALLPLWTTYYLKSHHFAAANGQWIAFTREAYRVSGGHAAVRQAIVDDVELSRLVKKHGIKMLTLSGGGDVFCRMYENHTDIWEGLSKNLFGLTGYNGFLFMALMLGLTISFILPFVTIFIPAFFGLSLLAIGIGLFIRLLLGLGFRDSPGISILLTPLAFGYLLAIAANSYRISKSGVIRWKNRTLQVKTRPE